MSNRNLYAAIAAAAAVHGDKFSTEAIDSVHESIREHYRAGRVIVETEYEDGTIHRRAGTISLTTGWNPAFLVMSSVSSRGSSDLLEGPHHRVVAVQKFNYYVSLRTGKQVPVNAGWHRPEEG